MQIDDALWNRIVGPETLSDVDTRLDAETLLLYADDRGRNVLRMTFWNEMTNAEIAKAHGRMSESWTTQVRERALDMIWEQHEQRVTA